MFVKQGRNFPAILQLYYQKEARLCTIFRKPAAMPIPMVCDQLCGRKKIGGSPKTLRRWVRHKEIDLGKRAGVTSEEQARIRQWPHKIEPPEIPGQFS